jgi:nitrite reductase (NADH) small subunit
MTDTKLSTTVAPLAAIPPGEGRVFQIAGERIAVFHARTGQVFATQAECPHKAGPLADGMMGGTTLVCPLHSWKFDLTTGEAQGTDCRLKTYPAEVDANGLVTLLLR